MAHIQISIKKPWPIEETQEAELTTVSTERGGVLIFDAPCSILRVLLNKEEAAAAAAKLAPYIP